MSTQTIEERLCRIEGMLTELLERTPKRKPRATPVQRAQIHDGAVERPLGLDMSEAWHEAWMHWCARRREAKLYMTELIIKQPKSVKFGFRATRGMAPEIQIFVGDLIKGEKEKENLDI